MRATTQGIIGVAFVLGLGSNAEAGNDDSFFQGNEAAMMAGAVTAVGTGAGQLWYNPAGLGLNTRNKLELSGSLFTLRIRHLDPFVDISQYDATTDEYSLLADRAERNVELLTVPSALSYTRRLGEHVTAGFGIFVQLQDSAETDGNVTHTQAGVDLTYRYSLRYSQERIFAGPGIGAQFGRLRIGASLFFVYDRLRIGERSSLLGTVAGTDAFASEDLRIDLRRMGVELVLGAQLQMTDHFVAGVVVRGPRLKINDFVEDSYQSVEALGDAMASDFGVIDERSGGNITSESGALTAPIETVLSLGYRSETFRFGVDADLAHTWSSLFEYAFTWNVRAGMAFVVSDTLEIGGGVFTDRASLFGTGAFGLYVDYYGGSLAGTFSTPVGLRPDDDDDGAPEKLIFRTTIALRYAFGLGVTANASAEVSSLDADPETFTFQFGEEQDVVFHEVGLYIGSGLDF